jgi:CRP-like cAMP-binding protein
MVRLRETLRQFSVFDGLSDQAIERLDSQCIWRDYEANELIIDEHEESDDVYFMLNGKVRVFVRAPTGKQTTLADIGDGEFFGELAAIDHRTRSATIVALTRVTLAKMPGRVFRDTVYENRSVAEAIMRLIVSYVRMLNIRLSEQRYLNVNSRIIAELIRLARPSREQPGQARISPPPIHQDLADRVNTHREAISRELKALREAGLVEQRRGALVLLDVDRLKSLIEAKE